MKILPKEQLLELHHPRWSGTSTWMGFGLAFCLVEVLLLLTLLSGPEGFWGFALIGRLCCSSGPRDARRT